jgi:HEAT repeat protein
VEGDPAPAVRAAALAVLVERRGTTELTLALDCLFDPDVRVRRVASESIAPLGEPTVEPLRRLVAEHAFDEPAELAAPAVTLARTGPQGKAALAEIAAGHPDERVRKIARMALGRLETSD